MEINSIDCKTLKTWLENDQVILIDVREISENKSVRIAAATLLPLAIVDIENLPELDDKKLVIQCRSGVRSLTACQKLLAQNTNLKIYNLEGGIQAWIADGFEVQNN